jgi:hypothetical protein
MSIVVKSISYFYATVHDKPGEGRKLLEFLSANNVNLLAFTAFPVGEGKTQFDFFPEDPGQLLIAAQEAGMKLTGPKKAFIIQGDDQEGALIESHLRLADAGINVHAGNGVIDGAGHFGFVLWVDKKDYGKAAQILGADL